MTKKDYIAIARAIRDARPILPRCAHTPRVFAAHEAIDNVARELADMLQRERAAFKREKFLDACGVPS